MRQPPSDYVDLADYCDRNAHLVERFIARRLEIDPARFSKLKSRKYGLRPNDAEEAAIADLLGRPRTYVRDLYTPEHKTEVIREQHRGER